MGAFKLFGKMSQLSILLNSLHTDGYVAGDYGSMKLKSGRYTGLPTSPNDAEDGTATYGRQFTEMLEDLSSQKLSAPWVKVVEEDHPSTFASSIQKMLRCVVRADGLNLPMIADEIERRCANVVRSQEEKEEVGSGKIQ